MLCTSIPGTSPEGLVHRPTWQAVSTVPPYGCRRTVPGGVLAHDVLLRRRVPHVQQVLIGHIVDPDAQVSSGTCSMERALPLNNTVHMYASMREATLLQDGDARGIA